MTDCDAAAATVRVDSGGTRQGHRRERQRVERDEFNGSGAVDAHNGGLRVSGLTAHDRHEGVLRRRMHGHVDDADAGGVGAEDGRDLLVDAGDVGGAGSSPGSLGAEVDGVDGGGHGIRGQEDAVRPESQGSD